MGLSFHYKGRIHNYSDVEKLTEEVSDICESLNWKYHVWKTKTAILERPEIYSADDLAGISISPDGCEPVFLTFLPDSRLVSLISFLVEDDLTDPSSLYFIHTKTQFAGPDIHIALMKLLEYIGKKYLSEWVVEDEGLYWNSKDENLLRSQFEKYNVALNFFEAALSGIERVPNESAESLVERIEQLLLKKFEKRE